MLWAHACALADGCIASVGWMGGVMAQLHDSNPLSCLSQFVLNIWAFYAGLGRRKGPVIGTFLVTGGSP